MSPEGCRCVSAPFGDERFLPLLPPELALLQISTSHTQAHTCTQLITHTHTRTGCHPHAGQKVQFVIVWVVVLENKAYGLSLVYNYKSCLFIIYIIYIRTIIPQLVERLTRQCEDVIGLLQKNIHCLENKPLPLSMEVAPLPHSTEATPLPPSTEVCTQAPPTIY